MFKLCLMSFKFYCHQITREDIEIDGGKVIVYFIHSMFSTVDMVELASPIMAVFSKKCILNVIHGFLYFVPANTWVILHLLEPIAIVVGSLVQRIWISETRD